MFSFTKEKKDRQEIKNSMKIKLKTHYVDFKKGANLLCNSKSLDGHWILEPDSFFKNMRIKTEYKNLCKKCIKRLTRECL